MKKYIRSNNHIETGTCYNNIITSHPVEKDNFKIVKTGCTENLNLNWKPRCLRLVSPLWSMLVLIP